MTMLVEMYYLQSAATSRTLAGGHNEVLNDLGITPEQTRAFYQGMQTYFDAHSLDAALSAYQQMGMIENSRLEKYMNVYRSMKKRKLTNALFMLSVKNSRLEQRTLQHVQSILAGGKLDGR